MSRARKNVLMMPWSLHVIGMSKPCTDSMDNRPTASLCISISCISSIFSSHLHRPPANPNVRTTNLSIAPPHIKAHHTIPFCIFKHELFSAGTTSPAPGSTNHHHPAWDNQPGDCIG